MVGDLTDAALCSCDSAFLHNTSPPFSCPGWSDIVAMVGDLTDAAFVHAKLFSLGLTCVSTNGFSVETFARRGHPAPPEHSCFWKPPSSGLPMTMNTSGFAVVNWQAMTPEIPCSVTAAFFASPLEAGHVVVNKL